MQIEALVSLISTTMRSYRWAPFLPVGLSAQGQQPRGGGMEQILGRCEKTTLKRGIVRPL
jgi:hypothetical protein